MMLLTFMKYALARLDNSSTHTDDSMHKSLTDTVETSPNDPCEDDLTWFSLSLDHRPSGRAHDELARLSLTTPEADSAANSDFDRWM
ncbi:hypothetical protein [Singulisphaera acidiphila]|uniref:Uncharacterized protein n=1 Tax=Singulisphaera acidiphila (strain ATCC BAA-1392 / DSM 18658 / VKM B-2454 / MOB10) TaxID=886293 RepID=L0D7B7_SINAD|nr:hypothetical protein [Singulisphaera acidiphila]AGA25294.1 hypothetical protein Sinac_0889 [Singulisphaera acidiphila DSM 18658]